MRWNCFLRPLGRIFKIQAKNAHTFAAFAMVLVCLENVSCASSSGAAQNAAFAPSVQVPSFRFQTLANHSQDTLDASHFRGKKSLVLFLTSWDLSSQYAVSQIRNLKSIDSPHQVLLVFLDQSKDPLLSYISALQIDYPCAWAYPSYLAGERPFGEVSVPAFFGMNKNGELLFQHFGLLSAQELDKKLSE